MKIDGGAIEFFNSIPDDVLAKIAQYDWEALERLCVALTIDVQLYLEDIERKKREIWLPESLFVYSRHNKGYGITSNY